MHLDFSSLFFFIAFVNCEPGYGITFTHPSMLVTSPVASRTSFTSSSNLLECTLHYKRAKSRVSPLRQPRLRVQTLVLTWLTGGALDCYRRRNLPIDD